MIIDTVENLNTYKGLSKNLDIALQFIQNTDLNGLPDGKKEIDDHVFFMVNDVARNVPEKIMYECHDVYIDIQMTIKGNENIRVLDRNKLEFPPMNKEKDIAFASSLNEGNMIALKQGDVMILFPQDAHQPCLGEGKGRKIVFKVSV